MEEIGRMVKGGERMEKRYGRDVMGMGRGWEGDGKGMGRGWEGDAKGMWRGWKGDG